VFPILKTSGGGGQIGENRDARVGSEESVCAGAGGSRGVDVGGSSRADGGELPVDQAAAETLSERRNCGVGASQCGARVEPSQAEEGAREGLAMNPQEVCRGGGRAIWSDAGSRAPCQRRRDRGRGRNAAAVDVSAGTVESREESEGAPEPGEPARNTLASWCSWTAVSMIGWRDAEIAAV